MSKNKSLALIVAVLFVFSALASGIGSVAFAAEPETGNRLAGNDAYETAVKIAQAAWTEADSVVLANGEKYADGLAGAVLAAKVGGPLLLTKKDALPAAVSQEIMKLGATKVYILGGEAVVSSKVADSLEALGLTVERVFGNTLYDTAAAIAAKIGTADTAVIASGQVFADALAVGPVAADNGWPILFTGKSVVPQATLNALKALGATKAVIVGGTGVVSDSVKDALVAAGLQVTRVFGATKEDTAVEIAKAYMPDCTGVLLANGSTMVDALAGGPLGAKKGYPVLFVKKSTAGSNVLDFVKTSKIAAGNIIALGGSAVIADSVITDVVNALDKTAPVISTDKTTVDVTADGQKFTFTVDDTNVDVEGIVVKQAGAVLPVTAESTAKTYSVSLKEVQGDNQTLTIDATDRAGNKAAQVSVTLVDKKAPSIADVQSVNGNQLIVTFSEKVKEAGAETVSNYMLRNVVTGQQQTLGTGDYAVLGNDGKTVVLTLSSATTNNLGVNGLNTLDDVQYRLFVNPTGSSDATRVKDTVDLAVPVNSYKDFKGTIGADNQAPLLEKATLDLEAGTNGQVVLKASEAVKTDVANIDPTKISVGSVKLTGATVDTTASENDEIVLNLTADLKGKIDALTGSITVAVEAGAFKDLAGNNNAAGSVVAEAAVYAKMLSATYDELANTLTLKFDKVIDVSAFTDFSGITLKGVATKSLADMGAVVKTTEDSDTVVFELTNVAAFEGTGAAPTNPTISITRGVFTTVDEKINAAVTDKALTYVNDDVKPSVVSASYDEATDLLHLTFSETVSVDLSKNVQFFADGDNDTPIANVTSAALYVNDKKDSTDTFTTGKEVWIAVPSTAVTKIEGITDKASLKMRLSAGVLVDTNGNANDAMTAQTQVAVAYTSSADKALSGVDVASTNASSLKLIKVSFESAMNVSTVENIANWQIYLKNNPANKVAVEKVDLFADGKTAFVWAKTALTENAGYVLKVSNLKDTFGNTFNEEKDLTATAATKDSSHDVKLTLQDNKVCIKDADASNSLSAADTITLVFSEPITIDTTKQLTAGNATDDFTTTAKLPNATFAMGANSNELVITVGADAANVVEATIGIAGSNDAIKTVSGQDISTAETVTIKPPAGINPPKLQSVKYTDSNANGAIDKDDELLLTFDVNVVAKDGDFNEKSIGISDATTAGALDLQDGAVISGKTVKVKLGEGGIKKADGSAVVKLTDIKGYYVTLTGADLTNTWGQDANDIAYADNIAITSDDKTGPALIAAKFVADKLDLNGDGVINTAVGSDETNAYGYLVITFDEAVNVGSAVLGDFDFDLAGNGFGKEVSDAKVLRFTDKAANADNAKKIVVKLDSDTVIDVGLVKINVVSQIDANKNIWDASGNAYRKTSATGVTVTQ